MVISLTCLAISKIPQTGEMAGPGKSLLCRQENLISQAPKKKSRGAGPHLQSSAGEAETGASLRLAGQPA